MNAVLPTATAPAAARPVRVMVVDDSVVVRGLITRWLQDEPGIEVVASLRNGREAVDRFDLIRPDVVLLDIEMPELDGLSALPLLLKKDRDLAVIMASTLTVRNAEATLRALSLGAADCVPKPEASRGAGSAAEFRRELIEKIRALGGGSARRRRHSRPLVAGASPERIAPPARPASPAAGGPVLRPFGKTTPRVLLIGSSTGGPQALKVVLEQLGAVIDAAPVLIVQHMPPTFTGILAEHLARASGRNVREAVDRERVVPGRVYVAPGGRHMLVEEVNREPVIALGDGPPVNFCRPSVDVLFKSAAPLWGPSILSCILTGMGSDGARGGADIVAAGGSVVAQDEPTSIVWGMPGAAVSSGICSAVLPLDRIAGKISRLFAGERG